MVTRSKISFYWPFTRYVASYRSLTIQVSNIRETKIFTNQSKNFLLNCNKRANIISKRGLYPEEIFFPTLFKFIFWLVPV